MSLCCAAIRSIFAYAALCILASVSFASESANIGGSKWPTSRIKIAVSSSLDSNSVIQGDLEKTLKRSLSLWSESADLVFDIARTDLESVSAKGVRGDGISLITIASTPENIRLFPREQNSPAAVTRVFANSSGLITEADIVLNPFVRFSTDGSFDTFDLQEVLTHEIGHLIGLTHSDIWGSVMVERFSKSVGSSEPFVARRRLPEMDRTAIRGLYGPKADNFECCGTLIGKVNAASKSVKTQVWLEEAGNGRVVAAADIESGVFKIEGVSPGDFVVRAYASYPDGRVSESASKVSVAAFESTKTSLTLSPPTRVVGIEVIGSTYQLGKVAIRISSSTPGISIGINGSVEDVARVGLSGTERWFSGAATSAYFQNQSVKVIQFDTAALAGLGPGEYTIVVEDPKGGRSFAPGALVVR